jgi:hypothetical protein
MFAANASIEVDVAPGLQARVIVARYLIDAIHRADFDARLAACTPVCVDNGQDLGDDFAGFAS